MYGTRTTANDWGPMMVTTEQFGQLMLIVRCNDSGPVLDSHHLLGESRFLVSGSADNMMKLWEVKTGKCLYTWEFPTAIKRVAFSDDDNLIACITEQRMGYQGAIRIFQINRKGDGKDQSKEPISMFHPIESKATVLSFSGSPDQLVTGHESGKLTLYNTKTGDEIVSNKRAHREVVTDIQMSPDRSYFITSSKDKSAKVRQT